MLPPCAASDIAAVAQTRPIASGVGGVIELTGRHCSLHVYPGPVALLDGRGNRLAVALSADHTLINPAGNQRTDLPLGAGIAAWGFSWRGSWCGAAAAAVVIGIGDYPGQPDPASSGQLIAPMTGPAPPCAGRSGAVLVPGVAGDQTEAVLSAPPDWAGLRATLTLTATNDGHTLTDSTVALTNTTDAPIDISPCPDYALSVFTPYRTGTELDAGGGQLACGHDVQVVPAHGEISYSLDPMSFGPEDTVAAGTVVTANLGIAAMPTAHATSTVR